MRIDVSDKRIRIDAELLIPGRGDPIPNATLVYSGKTISFVGATECLPSKYAHLSAQKVHILMPGMWDCHVHFLGSPHFSVDTQASTNMAVAGIRSARDVMATINAGFTSVRELSGYGPQLAQVLAEGWLPGPNIYSAVSMLSTTAGHGDGRSIPLEQLWGKIHEEYPIYLCDGVSECIKAVRVQIRRGATVIKVAASGGFSSDGDDVMTQEFNDEELKAIVDEATKNRIVVAAHCHGKAGIMAALKAGCRTIEHGTYLDEEAVKLMREKDAMLVATRSAVEWASSHPDMWTPEKAKQMLHVRERHKQSYRMAIKAGIRIALGTDLGLDTFSTPWNHGMNGREFTCAVEAGMTPLQAIEAGTARAPETLGPKAPKSGWLKEGYDADFIALAENPLEDIGVLSDTKKVLDVWKGGKKIKADGRLIDFLESQ